MRLGVRVYCTSLRWQKQTWVVEISASELLKYIMSTTEERYMRVCGQCSGYTDIVDIEVVGCIRVRSYSSQTNTVELIYNAPDNACICLIKLSKSRPTDLKYIQTVIFSSLNVRSTIIMSKNYDKCRISTTCKYFWRYFNKILRIRIIWLPHRALL